MKNLIGKYYIVESDQEGNTQPIFEINKEEYDNLLKSTNEIHEFRYYQRKILEIQLNYDDYISRVMHYEKELIKLNEEERVSQLDVAYVDINRAVINFTASFKFFLDHFEGMLIHKYSNTSDEVIKFKNINSANYNSMFAHRLLYYLRNYSQHQDYPIYNLGFTIDYMNGKPIKSKITPLLDKKELLQSKYLKKIHPDIERMNTTFPLEHQMLEIQKYITKLLDVIIEVEFHKLKPVAENIIYYHSKAKNRMNVGFGYYSGSFSWSMANLEVTASQLLLSKVAKLKLP